MHTSSHNHAEAQRLTAEGHEARRRADWQQAIECYNKALAIEPDGEAKVALEMTQAILDGWNRKVYDV